MTASGHIPEGEWMACGVCARVLAKKDEYLRGEYVGSVWDHEQIDKDRGWADHPPVPVPYSSLAAVAMVCDFCSERNPTWELPVADFLMPKFYANGDDWGSTNNWMACEVCADLIRRDIWPTLTQRAVDYLVVNSKLPRTPAVLAEVRKDIQRKYALVRKHQRGPIRPAQRAITVEALREIVEGKHRRDALGGETP